MMAKSGLGPARYVVVFRYVGVAAAAAGLLIGEWYTTIPNTIAGDSLSRVLAAAPWLVIVALQLFTLRRKSSTVNAAHAIVILLVVLAAHLSISAYLYDCNHGYCPMGQEFGNGSDEAVENGDTLVSVVYFLFLPGLIATFAIAALSLRIRIYTCLVAGSALVAVAVKYGFTMLLWFAVPLLAVAAICAIGLALRERTNDVATSLD